MKKLIIITSILLISLSGVAQKRTSSDVFKEMNTKVGNNISLVDQTFIDLMKEYKSLKIKELRSVPAKDLLVITPNIIEGFCFTCRCPNDPYMDYAYCGMIIPHCGICPACHADLMSYVQKCEGSPCGSLISMK